MTEVEVETIFETDNQVPTDMAIVAEVKNVITEHVIEIISHEIKVTEDALMAADKVKVLTGRTTVKIFGSNTKVLPVLMNKMEERNFHCMTKFLTYQ